MDILDFAEASDLLKISHPTLYRWVNEGKVRAFKAGRQWRFYRNDLLHIISKTDSPDENEFDRYISFFKKRLAGQNINNLSSDVFFNFIIADACCNNVKILHLNPLQAGYSLFYRISGKMVKIQDFSEDFSFFLKNEIRKIFKIEERICRHKFIINGDDVQAELTLLNTALGEKYTFNILNNFPPVKLEDIILFKEDRELIRNMTSGKQRILLITGPAGSGKTTTACGIIKDRAGQDLNIISIDENTGAIIEGVNQISELFCEETFRRIIKSDPDIIMMGEMNNPENLNFAIECAMAGSLVITQMKAWGVFNTIKRIQDLNVSPGFFDYLKGIISQKLLRKLCPFCCNTSGCSYCDYTGYKGFVPVYEMLTIDNELKDMIISRKPLYDIKEKALKKGMKLFYEKGNEILLKEITTEQEVRRVIGQDPETIVF